MVNKPLVASIYLMSLAIIAVVGVVIIVVVLLLSLKYKSSQALKCPYCQLDFTTDLFFLKQSTLVACPFCRRWMMVTRMMDRNVIRKLFARTE